MKGARIGSKVRKPARRLRAMDTKVTLISEAFVDSREFARMTRAIEFIEREYQRQPRLAEIAKFVGLSEFHFNRLFRRWTGLTPKQYLAEVTSRAAGDALRNEPSVMDAAHSVGLSGGGRLHDLTVTLEAMTPGEIRAGGEGVSIRHGIADTPFGTAFFAETPRGLCRLAFIDGPGDGKELKLLRDQWPKAKLVRDDERATTLVDTIWGHKTANLPLAVCGTNFQVQVWRALLELDATESVTRPTMSSRASSASRSRPARRSSGSRSRSRASWSRARSSIATRAPRSGAA